MKVIQERVFVFDLTFKIYVFSYSQLQALGWNNLKNQQSLSWIIPYFLMNLLLNVSKITNFESIHLVTIHLWSFCWINFFTGVLNN